MHALEYGVGCAAAQRRQRPGPLLLVYCLASAEVDAKRAEVGGTTCLGRAAEDVRPPGDLEVDKAGGYNCSLKLCFQQSAGNSTSP